MGNSTIMLWFAFFGLQVIEGTVRSEEREVGVSTIVRFAYAGTGTSVSADPIGFITVSVTLHKVLMSVELYT